MILLFAGFAARAWACGPDFPQALTSDRVGALVAQPEGTFLAEVATLVPPGRERFTAIDDAGLGGDDTGAVRARYEAVGLDPLQLERVTLARAAPNAAAAYALGEGLPEDVRLYTAGAVAFRVDRPTAMPWMARVLALPPAEMRVRGAWAAYTAAAYGDGEPSLVRDVVRAGALDPWGLAVGSLGVEALEHWQMRDGAAGVAVVWEDEVARAVALYAEQASYGSHSGGLSLLFVARALAAEPRALALAATDPLVRDLLTTYVWTRIDETPAKTVAPALADVLAKVDTRGASSRSVARIAAAAYGIGRYDVAKVAAQASSDEPVSAWISAKLALRDGLLDEAAEAYARAARGFPVLDATGCRVVGERGLVELARGNYVDALDVWMRAARVAPSWRDTERLWFDAAYVAERVLTIDELAAYVDARIPPPGTAAGLDDGLLPELPPHGLDEALRWLLARRLARDGQLVRAVAYFDRPDARARAVAYAAAEPLTREGDPIRRAAGFWTMGSLSRPGFHLLGTEGDPDYHALAGAYDGRLFAESSEVGEDLPLADAFLGPDEASRVANTKVDPIVRFHYRRTSMAAMWRAVELLPPTSQAYAVVLCDIARLTDNDAERERAWLQYVNTGPLYDGSGSFGVTCPAPDWDGARARARAEQRTKRVFAAAVCVVTGVFAAGLTALAGLTTFPRRARR